MSFTWKTHHFSCIYIMLSWYNCTIHLCASNMKRLILQACQCVHCGKHLDYIGFPTSIPFANSNCYFLLRKLCLISVRKKIKFQNQLLGTEENEREFSLSGAAQTLMASTLTILGLWNNYWDPCFLIFYLQNSFAPTASY